MFFLILAGTVSLLGGILLVFSPETLRNLSIKVSQSLDKVTIPIDEQVYKLRIGIGISLLLVSGMIYFIIYYLIRKYTHF